MTNRQIAQKVIDFEFSRTHIKDQNSLQMEDEQTQLIKFTDWNLENVMHELGLRDPSKYKVKWIGFEDGKFTDAFVYCLFKGCRSGFAAKNGIFIKLKYCLYQMACKFIKLGDQKNLVQVLCGAQYAKDLTTFLNRNPVFLKLFNKMLKNYLDSQMRTPQKSQIHRLKQFADNFDFIKFRILNQNIGQLLHFDEKFYIICEKQCCFVIEVQKQKQKEAGIKLNKILQSDFQNEPFVKGQAKSDNPEERKNQQRQKAKAKCGVPKFLLMNNKKKHKKSARYTEIQIQQDILAEFRGIPQNNKVKTLDPILISRAEHIISLQTIPKFIDVRGSLQPFTSIPQYSDEKSRRQNTEINLFKFAQNSSLRGKPGFFQQNKGKFTKKSKSKSPHDVTRIDQKNFKKPGLKKIELSLKKLISPTNKTVHYEKQTNSGQQYSPFISNIYNERSLPYTHTSNSHSYEKHHRGLLNGE